MSLLSLSPVWSCSLRKGLSNFSNFPNSQTFMTGSQGLLVSFVLFWIGVLHNAVLQIAQYCFTLHSLQLQASMKIKTSRRESCVNCLVEQAKTSQMLDEESSGQLFACSLDLFTQNWLKSYCDRCGIAACLEVQLIWKQRFFFVSWVCIWHPI